MRSMRRVAAAVAVSAVLGYTALPVLAALWCGSSLSNTCCAKPGDNGGTALERAPCCKVAVSVTNATREQVTPRASGFSAVGVATAAPLLSEPFALIAHVGLPACMQCPVSPPLGPPLRLRI